MTLRGYLILAGVSAFGLLAFLMWGIVEHDRAVTRENVRLRQEVAVATWGRVATQRFRDLEFRVSLEQYEQLAARAAQSRPVDVQRGRAIERAIVVRVPAPVGGVCPGPTTQFIGADELRRIFGETRDASGG